MHWSTSARSILRITNTGGSRRKMAHRDGIGPRCFGGRTFAALCSSGSLHPAVGGSTGELICAQRRLAESAHCGHDAPVKIVRREPGQTTFALASTSVLLAAVSSLLIATCRIGNLAALVYPVIALGSIVVLGGVSAVLRMTQRQRS